LKPKIRWMAEDLGVRRLPIDSLMGAIMSEIRETFKDKPVDISRQLRMNEINKKILREWIR